MWNSLRFRLTVIFIGLAVVPLIAVSAVLAERGFTAERDQAINIQRQVAERVAAEVQSYLRGVENDLTLLGGDLRGAQNLDRAQEISLLLSALSSGNYRDVYEDLILIDSNGQEQLHVSRAQIVTSTQAEVWTGKPEFEQPKATNQIYFSPVTLDDASGESYMNIAIPLHELRSINVSGVLMARLRFKAIGNLIASLQIGGSQTIYVVDPGTQIVAESNTAVRLGDTPLVLPSQDGDTTGLSGDNVILATDRMQVGGETLLIAAERRTSEALALAQSSLLAGIVITAIALVVAIALVGLTVRQIVRPVEQLSSVAEAIRAGDLSSRVTVTGKDEIGKLGQSFNEMTQQLVDSLAKMDEQVKATEQANKDLRIANGRAREAARLKSEFMASMSHELRTPLNAILGFTGIMLEGMGGEVDDEAEHMLTRIDSNSKRLLGLINDVLDIAKIEAGRMTIVSEAFRPAEQAKKWEAEMSVLAERNHLDLEVTVAPDLPEVLYGDTARLTQIVANLLSNAFKFTETGKVSLQMERVDQRWLIHVNDTGIGIPPHAINYIFDEFRQIDGTTTRMYGGTGLGLAIVRNLCRMMDGNVQVESTLGQGSRFTVTLPLRTENEPSDLREPAVAP